MKYLIFEGMPCFLLGSFFAVWKATHKSPGLPKRIVTGERYHPRREVWRNRGNGYTSDSGSSGPER
jgi:hypothetical protein